MKDNKLVPQTVYLPIENNISDFALAKLGRKQFADTLVTNQRLAKKDNQIVMSVDEFKKQLKSAYNAGMIREYENKFGYNAHVNSVPTTEPNLDTYINNLFII